MIDLRFFSWPWALILVVLLPLIAGGLLVKARRVRARRLAHLGTPAMIARLAPTAAASSRWQPLRLSLAALLLAVAFAGPRWGVEQAVVSQPGIDVILALDASSSMLARDEAPNRLAKMKQVVDRLREISPNDRFALIAFAGKSYVLSPITVDAAGLNLFIDNLDPTVVGQSGSSLASALRQANNLLALSKSNAERAIVLMSDGEGFENVDDVRTESERAASAGTTVITVGFGSVQGATIPVTENGTTTDKKDQQGNVVVSKYSPDLLKAAAEAGKGVFVPPTDPDRAAAVRQTLARLRTEQRAMSKGTNLAQRFQYFLLPAILLLLLDAFLATRRGRRRDFSPVGTTASMIMLATFFNGCSSGGVRDKDAARMYNSATAMMAKPDSVKAALPFLKKAALSVDTVVQYRAGFNAGLIHLREGLAIKGDSAAEPLDSALAVYKRVLTLEPNDPDAKWNYELALRKQKNGGGGGGGGAGGGAANPKPQPEPGGNANPTPQPRPVPGMNEAKAEQILNSMEQQEQDVQGRKQRRSVPTPPPNGRDW